MKLHNDSWKMVKFYEKLGFSKEQSLVLWEFHYNDWGLMSAIKAYNQSSLKLKWTSFCKSVADFMEFIEYGKDEKISYSFWWLYNLKLSLWSKNDWITKSELIKKYEAEHPREKFDEIPEFCGSTIQYCKSAISFDDACCCVEKKMSICADEDESLDDEYDEEVEEEIEEDIEEEIEEGNSKYDNIFEKTRYDKYQQIDEKWFLSVLSNPTSTIRTNCNTASMDIIRENILKWYSVSMSMVRAEELLNYFRFDLKDPEKGNKFWITVKLWDKPNSNHKMLLVWIQWEKVLPTRQNIVALLDASWSMGGNEVQMQWTIMTLISKLNDGDKFSLITQIMILLLSMMLHSKRAW